MDDLREQIAQALADRYDHDLTTAIPMPADWYLLADAVLALLPTYEQVGVDIDGDWFATEQVAVTVLEAAQIGRALAEARLAEALDVLREGVDGLTHTAHAPPGWIDRARALLGDDR